MQSWIYAIQMTSSVILIISILLQNQGSGVGELFGGTDTIHTTKRGSEKFLFIVSLIFSILFFVSSSLLIFL